MAEASHRKLRQMLELLIMLGSSKYGRDKKSLAEHFEISEKTVNRYFDTFTEAGFVIDKKNGLFSINKKETEYKDLSELLHFSEDESEILSKAIDSIETTTDLKEQLKLKLYSIYNFDRVATPLAKKHNNKIISLLTQAIENKKQVILKNYSSANSQNISDRLVEPFNFTHNYTSVWAYEPETNTNKTFKIDRISKIEILKSDFMFEKNHKKNDLDVFRMSSDKKIEIKLILSIKAFNLLIEEFPRAEKYTKKLKNDKFELTTKIADFKGVGRFIMGLPKDIEINYPQELKEFILAEMKKGIMKFENMKTI
jgi:predicted DNA-binding transcriptional regulator YafY